MGLHTVILAGTPDGTRRELTPELARSRGIRLYQHNGQTECQFSPGRILEGHNLSLLSSEQLIDAYVKVEKFLRQGVGVVEPWPAWRIKRVEVFAHVLVPEGCASEILRAIAWNLHPRKCEDSEEWVSNGKSVYWKSGAGQQCIYDKEAQVLKDRRLRAVDRKRLAPLVHNIIRVEDRLWGRRLKSVLGGDRLADLVRFREHGLEAHLERIVRIVEREIGNIDLSAEKVYARLREAFRSQRNGHMKAMYLYACSRHLQELGPDGYARFYDLDREQMRRIMNDIHSVA